MDWAAVHVLGMMGCWCSGLVTLLAMWTGLQFTCWERWVVGVLDSRHSGPCGLGCSSRAGQDGLSVYWTRDTPGHVDWAAVHVLGKMGCRCTGLATLQAMWTGLQFTCWARWVVGVLDSRHSGPCGLSCSSHAGQDGLSVYWTRDTPGHLDWTAVHVLGMMDCRCTGLVTLRAMWTGLQFTCWE